MNDLSLIASLLSSPELLEHGVTHIGDDKIAIYVGGDISKQIEVRLGVADGQLVFHSLLQQIDNEEYEDALEVCNRINRSLKGNCVVFVNDYLFLGVYVCANIECFNDPEEIAAYYMLCANRFCGFDIMMQIEMTERRRGLVERYKHLL